MSVDEAKDFFADKDKSIDNMFTILQRVGMGYIRLGQATPTISGGESQRIKLAKELSKGKSILCQWQKASCQSVWELRWIRGLYKV